MSWETEAENWIAWAGRPDHDAYWYYRDSFFEEIVPAAGRATLDLGCGEGRVARDLSARGHRVTAVDAAPTLLAAAQEADPTSTYVLADAAALPFEDSEFDLVVAYNSLMDIDDMPGAVAEAGRALEPRFVVESSYLAKRRFEGTFERDGLTITFRGWCYALGDYARGFEDAGFMIERLREPTHPMEDPRHDRIPLFLQLRAVKPE